LIFRDLSCLIYSNRRFLHRCARWSELAELEAVAVALMEEARRIRSDSRTKRPGARQAVRFQVGLMLALLWRTPLRARNWAEALLGTHLKHEDGRWWWHFEGDDLKIGQRGTEINVFEPEVSADVVPMLEEFLDRHRPHLPNAARDPHVFLSYVGNPLTPEDLLRMLSGHVLRYTGKRLYTHLLRSIFSTYHLTHGVDINSVAFAMNDTPKTVLQTYNQIHADRHIRIIADANQRALAHGPQTLTPPVVVPRSRHVPYRARAARSRGSRSPAPPT
jgi:hypothetical protein